MKIYMLFAAVISVICSCAPLDPKAPNTPVEITANQFANHHMEYVLNGNFEQYTFGEEGDSILCSRGGEEESLGLVYDWVIIDGKTLLLTAKKGVNVRVQKIRMIEGYPFISQVGEIEYHQMDASIKTVRLQFSEVSKRRAVTLGGKVFKKSKYQL